MGKIEGNIKNKIETSETLIKTLDFQNAIDLLLDVLSFFTEIGDTENGEIYLLKLHKCYRSLAKQLQEQEDYSEAAETYCSAAFLHKEYNQNEIANQLFNDAIDCFVCAGKSAFKNELFRDASTLYCSAATYAKNELHDMNKSKKYHKKAVESLELAINHQDESDDAYSLCQNHLDLGKIFVCLEEHENAINQFKKVVELSISNDLSSYTADGFQIMALCYEQLGNSSAMIECLNSAVHYRMKEGEKFYKNDLPLEAVQNYIAAADCVSRLGDSNHLLSNILENEANCFLIAAKWNAENGQILQAAYYERNAAYCYDQLGKPDASIDLFLKAAEKLLSIDDYSGAANNFYDASLYEMQVGNYLKAANLAMEAAKFAKQSDDLDLAIQNFMRASQIYQSIGYTDKVETCNLELAECFQKLAEENLISDQFHPAAFSFYQAAILFSKSANKEMAKICYEKAVINYKSAMDLALKDNEMLLASYSACCATLVCLILQQPARAESILNNIKDNSPNNYYLLSNSIINAFKTKNHEDYTEIQEKFHKLIQKSLEIKDMLEFTEENF